MDRMHFVSVSSDADHYESESLAWDTVTNASVRFLSTSKFNLKAQALMMKRTTIGTTYPLTQQLASSTSTPGRHLLDHVWPPRASTLGQLGHGECYLYLFHMSTCHARQPPHRSSLSRSTLGLCPSGHAWQHTNNKYGQLPSGCFHLQH